MTEGTGGYKHWQWGCQCHTGGEWAGEGRDESRPYGETKGQAGRLSYAGEEGAASATRGLGGTRGVGEGCEDICEADVSDERDDAYANRSEAGV
jgi:hypothetical protein